MRGLSPIHYVESDRVPKRMELEEKIVFDVHIFFRSFIHNFVGIGTWCSLNIVFKILKYSGLWPFSVFPRCQLSYQAGRTPALQQNWHSSEKSLNYKEKTQYLKTSCTLHYVKG